MVPRILLLLAALALAAPIHAQTPATQQVQVLTDQARQAPGFRRIDLQLDIYRVLTAAGVSLSNGQSMETGELALTRGLNVEAEAALKPLIASGVIGGSDDRQAARNNKLFSVAAYRADNDRRGDLVQAEAKASTKATGYAYVALGEAHIGPGNFETAAALISKGLAKGGMAPGEIALAQLHLGIAQYRGGRAEEARKTWASIRSDNGAEQLAQAWLAVSPAT